MGIVVLAALGAVAWPVINHFNGPSDQSDQVTYGQQASGSGGNGGGSAANPAKTLMPTGPQAHFRVQNRLPDGTTTGVVTLKGPKSGFTGKVWVWAPKQYSEPKYARSGFPVMVALQADHMNRRTAEIARRSGVEVLAIDRWFAGVFNLIVGRAPAG